ncbi:SWIM zinc finger family protein [Streptomyces avicenniae]|uniref:SWIM zinc finger family protein n=1 Tax=Streptomyces avicenniae TaxID=500153 RepID=UPI000B2CA6CD|nr:SWIM zinc finger family protein [Streptomyces avicenniae]
MRHPEQFARSLLSVLDVAHVGYDRRRPAAPRDPVASSDGERLRFESLSVCGGVAARLDVLPDGIAVDTPARGSTSVEAGPQLRAALDRVRDGRPLRLVVGHDEPETASDTAPKRRVPLPERWLRAFAELHAVSARLDLRAEMTPAEAARFLATLPGATGSLRSLWAVPVGDRLRTSMRPAVGAVHLAGPGRLAALRPLLRFATALRVYGPPVRHDSAPTASAWELLMPGMRLVLTLSPDARAGFPGSAPALDALEAERASEDAGLIESQLDHRGGLDLGALAGNAGLGLARVRTALGLLGSAGRLGYDVAEAAYFHRDLPYDAVRSERLIPRLAAARALLAEGQVRVDSRARTATVAGPDRTHEVTFAPDGIAEDCTCHWWAEHRVSRGKCRHALAAELARRTAHS